MKRLISIIAFASLVSLFPACGKDNSTNNAETRIIGSWELRQSSGGMRAATDYPAANGNILKFTGSNYESFTDGQLVKRGTYSIVSDTTVEASVCLVLPAGEFRNRIIYDNDDQSTKVFIQITGNKLSIISGCYAVDAGHRRDYEKQSGNN
ncbi:MAG: hypothetical protein JWQ40_1032 [Segetibacter sp.]|nr:hypothetical protein [Segetibacter sp.]